MTFTLCYYQDKTLYTLLICHYSNVLLYRMAEGVDRITIANPRRAKRIRDILGRGQNNDSLIF